MWDELFRFILLCFWRIDAAVGAIKTENSFSISMLEVTVSNHARRTGIGIPFFLFLNTLVRGVRDIVFCHSERNEESLFRHFWLDPKVTKRSRLRALHTPSRRLQVGKSGNSLRFGQPDFLSPCSLLRRLTARGRRTNAGINCQWLIVNCYFPDTWFGVYHA